MTIPSRRCRHRLLPALAVVALLPLMTPGGTAAAATTSTAAISTEAPTAAGLVGSQGDDVALPDTDSAATAPGTGRFTQMSFHLSKTRNLTNEAISVSWTGGPAGSPTGPLEDTNFVQLMECWGDPVTAADGTVGPPPEQCVFGADPDGLRLNATNNGFEFIRARLPAIENWVPFRGVDGTVVTADTGPNPNNPSASTWLNPFYAKGTSNEIGGLRNGPDGKGSAFFDVDTGLQSAGLGCGQKMTDGSFPRCWLVAVPRAPHDDIPGVDDRGQAATTPLDTRGPWKDRVAVPLEFTPVASGCALSNAQQSISGADLALPAMDRWLPALCTQAGAPPYIYTRTEEDRARTLLAQRVGGGSGDGMIVTNTPIDPQTLPAGRKVVYAPLDISAVVVGFSIQRHGIMDGLGGAAEKAFEKLESSYVAHLKLTPRLVAKLLTQSYAAYLQPGTYFLADADKATYGWSADNPKTMFFDPDFTAANPEFTVLAPTGIESATTLEVSLGSSAAATAVWNWIRADPAAMKWLSGVPDEYGMKVNPYYCTNAAANPNHAAFAVPPSGGFPKNDPLSWISTDAKAVKLPMVSLNNEWPYQDSLQSTAKVTRTGNRGAKINYDPNSPLGYSTSGTQPLGSRAMFSITDAADAQRFGIQRAALRNANGDFVEPTADSVSTAVAAMVADRGSTVMQVDQSVKSPGAYPLTTIDYAASVPSALTAKERVDYSRLLRYAAGPGQITGESLGTLPRGYVALPGRLRAQTLAAAFQVGAGLPAMPVPATTAPTPTQVAHTSAPVGTTRPTKTPVTFSQLATSGQTTVPQTSPAPFPIPPSQQADVPAPLPSVPAPVQPPDPVNPVAGSTADPGPGSVPGSAAPATPIGRTNTKNKASAGATESTPAAATPSTASAPAVQTVVQLAATTSADPGAVPWTAVLLAIAVAAGLGIPLVGRASRRRRR